MASTSNMTPSSALSTAVDVVVVSAGLGGLRAALAIQAAGLSCAVVEATNRVGGKTLTLQSKKAGPGVNDLGAAWINNTSQSEMYKLVQRYGLQTVVQMDTGLDVHLHGDEVVVCPHGVLPVWFFPLRLSSYLAYDPNLWILSWRRKSSLHWVKSSKPAKS
jgi:monoamine oxidase